MKRITILFVIISMVCSGNTAEPLNLDDLAENLFESMSAEGTNIVLKFKSSGRRFEYSVNKTAPKVNAYGEELRIPIGSHIRIVGKGTEMVFSSLPLAIKDAGFHVRLVEDHRSGGKMRREKERYLVFQERLKDARSIPDKNKKGGLAIIEASFAKMAINMPEDNTTIPALGEEERRFVDIAFNRAKEAMEITDTSAVTVEYKDNIAIVSFPCPRHAASDQPPYPGPDFLARVKIDRATGNVLEILGAP